MNDKIKISIVTPTYNQGRFICQTLQSILRQKGDFELEYIIQDALSFDRTPQIIKEYLPKFKNAGVEVKYLREKDKGQSDGINRGWKKARGGIVTYINSDDFYEPGALQAVASYFRHHADVKWAYGGWNLVDERGRLYKSIPPKKYSRAKLLNYCDIGQPSCFFRRGLLKEVGLLNRDLHLAMDYDLWLRFAEKYPAGNIKKVLSNLRYHSQAKSGSQTKGQLKEVLGLGSRYTKPLSWRRFCQYYYFLRGLAVVIARQDITKRIERSRRIS